MSTATTTAPQLFAPSAADKKDFANELRKQTVACRLSHSKLGVRKALTRDQLRLAAEQFDADGKSLSASKRLIDTRDPAYRAVINLRSRATDYWRSFTVPYPEPGIRLIRRGSIDTFDKRMAEFRRELREAAEKLQAKYDELRDRAREQLGTLFNEDDYPSRIDIEFDLHWDFPSVDPPEYLKNLNPELYERQCDLARARIEQAVQMTEEAFVGQFHKLVTHLVERLRGDVDGKPKVFRDSAIENLTVFFEQFRALDVGSNAKLQSLVDMAQQAVKGVSPEDLRANQIARQQVGEQLAQIQQAMDELMVAKPKRAINLQDEEQANA
jgi:hypothetical protein